MQSARVALAIAVAALALSAPQRAATAIAAPAATGSPDVRIAELVASVSPDRIRTHVARLAGAPRDDEASRAAAASYVAAELEQFGYTVTRDPVIRDLTEAERRGRENVVARRSGVAKPARTLLVGAHVDSVPGSPGADDNASGLAALLEVARALAKVRSRHTLEFNAFALEEEGLVGSAARARAAHEKRESLLGMVSLEMVGFTCPSPCQAPFRDIDGCLDVDDATSTTGDWIGVTGNRASRALKRAFVEAATRFVPDLSVKQGEVVDNGACFPDTRRSDHAPFWDRGFPALLITDTADFRNPNYHRASDTPDTLDIELVTQVARATVAFAALEIRLEPGPAKK